MAGLLPLTLINASAAPATGVPAGQAGSKAFAIGEWVRTIRRTRVWVTPPTAGAYAGEQLPNAAGRIVDGPVRAADVWWWKVNFETSAGGWTSERDLTGAGAATNNTSQAPATAAPAATFSELSPATGTVINAPQATLRGRITHDIYGSSQITASLNGRPLALDIGGNFSATVNLAPGNNDFTLKAVTPNPRQQTTKISAYLDASMVYGSDSTRANALRTFQGGALKTSAGNLPPFNTAGLENANDAHLFPDSQLFLAGDIRANENLELTAIHTLFVREHNLLAAAIASANPGLNDEQIYQQARRLVAAEVQVITFHEFLPALLGLGSLRPYAGYNPNVNAGIATEFSTGAFRIGHTLINDDVEFLDNDAKEVRAGLPLAQAFFNPRPLEETGPDPLLKYLATDNAQEVDTQLVDGLRDFLFGPPGAGGLDLASLNIQRGRDHGLPDYNTVRRAYGLPALTSFAQITSDPALQAKLQSLYGNVNSLDLWVAGLAEDHVAGSSVGPTFQRIIVNQFERIRDGDRNWYERTFAGRQLAALQATRLSDIIRRNTTITKLQDNVFFYDPNTTLAGLLPRAGVLPQDLIPGQSPGTPLPPPPAALDGMGNNLTHITWGSAGSDLLRFAPAAYEDGISSPAGSKRPSARLISNTVSVLTTPFANSRLLSSWVYGWGQFIDHDLDLTTTGDTAFDIPVPTGDPSFDPGNTGTSVIPLSRSNYDSATGASAPTVTEQIVRIVFKAPPPKR